MFSCTFTLNSPDDVSPPVLKLQPRVFHGLILGDVAHMQHAAVKTLLIHSPLGSSETESLKPTFIALLFNFAYAVEQPLVCVSDAVYLALVSFWNLTR